MSESLCTKCQKFYGNPQNQNMCSVCYKYLALHSDSTNNKKASRRKCKISKFPKLPNNQLHAKPIILAASPATKR